MRLALAILVCALAAWAQTEQPAPTPEQLEIARLQALADQVKEALTFGSLGAATKLSDELARGILQQHKFREFKTAESLLPSDGPDRIDPLAKAANAAFEAADYTKAETYARELLALALEHPEDKEYGVAVFYGNMVLGRVALARDHNIKEAKAALIASGKTPGSATLNSFGPNMSLAQDLLAVGERDVVLQFFDQCRAFWKDLPHLNRLQEWSDTIKGCCRMPDFGANLVY
jgi:hypothetical protein